jgi:hypothetical protein
MRFLMDKEGKVEQAFRLRLTARTRTTSAAEVCDFSGGRELAQQP